ncbi:hypothetical protein IFO69_05290 [Echinicola sp. CAU 1574]|uniref:YCII-related domain-containing protein n=1 Tax=Echinicola arenosa TaxID=2774144 RepID=A0ABR9AHG8_9BACT|nr:YciI-like protein [Echinicola arenosa]MBD8488155.1 hypothetical protein [Echinicola arenosa]
MHFILTYHTVPNYTELRKPYRSEHLTYIQDFYERGLVTMAGALEDPADQAVIIFKCDNPSEIENFAKNDPYVKNGLIASWSIRPWNVVIGKQ